MEDEKLKEEYWKFLKKGLWIFGIGVLLMIASPMIWTLRSGWINFSNTGEIGDTIGGLTAPVIGIIGAALVFLSFMEQWRTNQIQYREISNSRNFEILEKRISKLQDSFPKAYQKGLLPLRRQSKLTPDQQKPFSELLLENANDISRAYFVFQEFIQLDNHLENSRHLTEEQVKFLKDQLFIIILNNIDSEKFDKSTELLLSYFDHQISISKTDRFITSIESTLLKFSTIKTKYYGEYIS